MLYIIVSGKQLIQQWRGEWLLTAPTDFRINMHTPLQHLADISLLVIHHNNIVVIMIDLELVCVSPFPTTVRHQDKLVASRDGFIVPRDPGLVESACKCFVEMGVLCCYGGSWLHEIVDVRL